MPRSVDLYLNDMLTASDDILGFAKGLSEEDYAANRMLRAAIER